MIDVSDEQFQAMIDAALGKLAPTHIEHLQNVAILFADEPNAEQRARLKLLPYQSLYGLYEGLPLSQRQGRPGYLPDKITLFKLPMLHSCNTIAELEEQIKHTLWHEIAHYYGLDHDKIRELE